MVKMPMEKRFHTLCLDLGSAVSSALSASGISVFLEITFIRGCAFLLVSAEELSPSILSDTIP